MSDEEEETFCYFGKPLEPYDEDAFPKKKPIAMEDQVATDAQGRRRFHGAFTGGFSAGFYNTVGSLEGWTPSEFKSTRETKAQSRVQRPEDFMDEEDTGEFGIAPQTVKAGKDFDTSKKRKRQVFSDGPIPGEPVLHSLLTSGNETVGYMLLKNIGLKDRAKEIDEGPPSDRVYGCEMPKSYEIKRHDDFEQYPIADIYREYLKTPKSNTFGLGYSGLDKSHLNLFTPAKLVVTEKNKKKLSISGQAFGVGAFEDDDEDIYVKEDMTRYDFELTLEKAASEKKRSSEEVVYDIFVRAKNVLPYKEVYAPPTIPHSFTGKHKQKKSRFEPLPTEVPQPAPIKRKDVNAEVRAKALGEEPPPKPVTPVQQTESKTEKIKTDDGKKSEAGPEWTKSLVLDRFVSAGQQDQSNPLEEVVPLHTEHGTEEMRAAVHMKMFGPLTRISSDWHPCSILCRRFNVPEPHLELSKGAKKERTKNLIFEYQKHNEVPWDLKPGLSKTKEVQETNDEENNPPPEVPMEVTIATDTKKDIPESSESLNVPLPPAVSLDITEKIDLIKNMDLFKAVFQSSSESEESDNENEKELNKDTSSKNDTTATTSQLEIMKTQILSDSFLLKIQPIREGILSNVTPQMLGLQRKNNEPEIKNKKEDAELDPNLYGPVFLPTSKPIVDETHKNDKKKTSIQIASSSTDDDGDWVEKDDSDAGNVEKKLKKKKDKKKKSHHKKHKRKHKHKRSKS